MGRYFYHASPIANLASILAHGLRAGADGYVHLTTDQNIAIYCVHIRWNLYQRYAEIAVFQTERTPLITKTDNPDALFAEYCYVHPGDVAKDKVTFVMKTQMKRG